MFLRILEVNTVLKSASLLIALLVLTPFVFGADIVSYYSPTGNIIFNLTAGVASTNGVFFCLEDGTNCPASVGGNGTPGTNGTNGLNGTGISTIYLLANGSLQINLTNGTNITTGNLTGAKGDTGAQGDPGADGAPGQAGTNGTNGVNGTNGLNATANWTLAISTGNTSVIANTNVVNISAGAGILLNLVNSGGLTNVTITSLITQYTDALAAAALQNTTIARKGDVLNTTTALRNTSDSRINVTGVFNALVVTIPANSLTGTDIDESSLGVVPNAADLSGCTDCISTTEITDSYVLAAGDTRYASFYFSHLNVTGDVNATGLKIVGGANITGNITTTAVTGGVCFNSACTARIYHNGSALIMGD